MELTEELACYTVLNMVETIMDRPTTRNKHRKKRTILDRDKAMAMRAQGATITDIAEATGSSPPAVYGFLRQLEPEFKMIEEFKQHRGDVFSRLQAKSIGLQFRIIEDLDRILPTLTDSQKASLLHTLTVVSGTAFDKERLERGQSTQNHSIMTRMLHSSVDSAYKSDTSEVVAVPTKVRNANDKKANQLSRQPPGVEPPPPSPSAQGEAGRGDSLAASVYGHPTESTSE